MSGLGRGLTRLRALLAEPGGHLLPLRGFLGVTFVFAGMQKLANPAFFRASSPTSIQQQLADVHSRSPIGFLVGVAQHDPVLVGALIALCELAVGICTLLGLLTRPAAVLGLLLSLSFFLTVSWQTSPYYFGADIVFVFAWVTMGLHGATRPSLDLALARHAAAARSEVKGAGEAAQRRLAQISRREAVGRWLLGGAAGAVTLLAGGVTALIGKGLSEVGTPGGGTTGPTLGTAASPTTTTAAPGTPTTAAPASTTPAPTGTRIGPASGVPVGGAASFTDPSNGLPAYVVQPTAGTFDAFSAVCTHQGCTVGYVQSSDTFDCPCHGSIFNARTGAVLQGPAPAPLPRIPVELGPEGQLYVTS